MNGHLYSPGVHYVGEMHEGGITRRIYEGLGIGDDLTFMELNPDGYDHIRIGDTRFDVPAGFNRYSDRLASRFPRQARQSKRYLEIMRDMARELTNLTEVRNPRDGVAAALRSPTLARYGLSTLDGVLDAAGVTDPTLRAVLTVQAGDHGAAPSEASAPLHAAVVAHYFAGGYYPKGGARSLPKAMLKGLRAHGGKIQMRARVDKILFENDDYRKSVVGVRLADGTEISAKRVVSNADPHVTFTRLMDKSRLPRSVRWRLGRAKYSLSAMSLFMSTDADLRSWGLDSGNYWYSPSTNVNGTYDYAWDADPLRHDDVPSMFLTVDHAEGSEQAK